MTDFLSGLPQLDAEMFRVSAASGSIQTKPNARASTKAMASTV